MEAIGGLVGLIRERVDAGERSADKGLRIRRGVATLVQRCLGGALSRRAAATEASPDAA